MIKKWALIFLLITSVLNEKIKWVQQLTKYIEKDAKSLNQIIILQSINKYEKNTNDNVLGMLAKFPHRIINFESETVEEQIAKLQMSDPRTALFVMLHHRNKDQDFSRISEPINFVSNISESRSRPKLLVVSFENNSVNENRNENENEKYNKRLLRRMWSLDFLDVTLLSTLAVKSNSFYRNDYYQLTAVYHYNPHTHLATISRKLKATLFPDKTRNLQKYPLDVYFFHYPPEVMLPTENDVMREIHGLGWTKFETLSKAMNFRMVVNFKNDSSNPSEIDCKNKYNSTGLYSAFYRRKIEFLAVEHQRFLACDEEFHEWALGIVDTKLVLVVPVLSKESYVLNDKWAIFRLLAMASFPFIIWLCVRFSRLNSESLQLIYLIQITLGWTVPREPKKRKEKAIFAVLLLTCTLYNSMIYTTLTDIGLHKQTKYSFETMDDVLSSKFPTLVHVGIVRLMEHEFSNMSHLLLQKVIRVKGISSQNIIKQVYTSKNVTCVAFSMNAKFLLQEQWDYCHLPVAKLLENDYIARPVSGTAVASRSPYVKRVNVLIRRLIESGITEKWKLAYNRKLPATYSNPFCFNRSNESQVLLWKIFFIIIIGYLLSIFTFCLELILFSRL